MPDLMHGKHLLPVIHHRDAAHSYAQAETALSLGASGVFLIEMAGMDDSLFVPAMELKRRHPQAFIGANFLSLDAHGAISVGLRLGLDGIWVDNPGVSSRGVSDEAQALSALLAFARRERPFTFFGSVAFKTQVEDMNPALAAQHAAALGWIATTSGTATGVAPGVEKMADMKRAVGASPLAVASGITPENVTAFLPYVDIFLVATGISRDEHTFDPKRLCALAASIRGADHPQT